MSDPGSSAPPIDDDPVYDGDLWSFSAFFPPPYRVLLLASIGLLLFAVNVKVLQSKGIDLFALFRADQAEKKRTPPSSNGFHRSTTGATAWLRVRGYISTARKHGVNVMTAIHDAVTGHPWTPPAPFQT